MPDDRGSAKHGAIGLSERSQGERNMSKEGESPDYEYARRSWECEARSDQTFRKESGRAEYE